MVGDSVRVTVTVPVAPALAFEVFTRETDLWWRHGIRYRVAGRKPGVIAFEPRVGGRLFEQYESDDGPHTHVAGEITAWEPGVRLEFSWRGANFAEGEVTHVTVTFTASESGRRVELVHRGFAALRPDHPVRHGEEAAAFIRQLGMWWSDLLTALRVHALREPAL